MQKEKESTNKYRNIIWTMVGILLLSAFVVATTIISDDLVFTTGDVNATNINVTNLFSTNLTIDNVLFLSNDYTLSGQSKILKRNRANGAVFGVENLLPGVNDISGAGYVLITNTSNYTIDLHSDLDTNNPDQIIHHLRGDATAEKWRVQNGTFEFERGLDDPVFIINTSSTIVTVFNLSGTGNAFVCADADGVIFRSGVACV